MDFATDGRQMRRRRTTWARACSILTVVWFVCAASNGLADEGERQKPQQRGFVAGEIGYEGLGEDDYIGLRAKGGFQLPVPRVMCPDASECWTRLLGQFELPLRLRVVYRNPPDSGAIRDADWDEVAH